jgi:hypothetical protein
LKVDVDLVTLNFSIRDKAKRTVNNVQKEDIAIYEDEVNQEVTFFDTEPAPLSLIVLLDVSESVRAFSSQIKAASKVLPDLLREGDEVAVIAFFGPAKSVSGVHRRPPKGSCCAATRGD